MPMQLPPRLAALSERFSQFGFERTRRALAALALSAFVTLYFLVSLNPDLPEGLGRVFLALSVCYAVGFLGVVAEWFWGRWFATGLAWSGVMMAIAVMAMLGWVTQLAVFGGLHLLVAVTLMGNKMAARYDLQEAWRARYKIDEYGVARLRKAVTSAAASLPSMIMWALGPKDGDQALVTAGGLAVLVLAVLGLRGLVRLRSWGVVALGGAAALAVTGALFFAPICTHPDLLYHAPGHMLETSVIAAPQLAVVFLMAAVIPFVRPVARFLRRSA
ncbi:MAG TPA: hypothetical protein VKQ32_04180 [Polyangia bacterium]|nr:hypothetical protein [Polyangia bacterium]